MSQPDFVVYLKQQVDAAVDIPDETSQAGSVVATSIATPAAPAAGEVKTFTSNADKRFHDINEDGVVGTTVIPNAGAANKFVSAIGTDGTVTLAQPAISDLSGTLTITDGASQPGSFVFTGIADPGAPSVGYVKAYANLASKRFHDVNSDNVIGTTVVSDTGSANNFLTAISTAGVISKAQPSFANLSGTLDLGGAQASGTLATARLGDVATPGTTGSSDLIPVVTITAKGLTTGITTAANKGGWTVLRVAGSDATTTGASLVDITGLVSGTLTNSTLYEIDVLLFAGTSADTNGIEVGVHGGGTGTAATVNALVIGTLAAATASQQTINAIDTATTALLTDSNSLGTISIKGFVTTKSTGTATISIQHLKPTSGTSTIKIGSVFRYRLAA